MIYKRRASSPPPESPPVPVKIHDFDHHNPQVERLLDTLAEAFATSPLARRMAGSDTSAAGKNIALAHFTIMLKATTKPAFFKCLSNGLGAILALDYPREQVSSFRYALHGGLWSLVCNVPLSLWPAWFWMNSHEEKLREQYMQRHGLDRMVVFVSTAVHPSMQGRGLSTKLRNCITSQADAQGLHCYAEANDEVSKLLLEKHGFRQVGEPYRPFADVPYLYPMARPPTKSGAANLTYDSVKPGSAKSALSRTHAGNDMGA